MPYYFKFSLLSNVPISSIISFQKIKEMQNSRDVDLHGDRLEELRG
jgi:hypothetical protein